MLQVKNSLFWVAYLTLNINVLKFFLAGHWCLQLMVNWLFGFVVCIPGMFSFERDCYGYLGAPESKSQNTNLNHQFILLTLYIYIYTHTLGIQSPCQRMVGVSNPLLNKVFRFYFHSQKVIGSLGTHIHIYILYYIILYYIILYYIILYCIILYYIILYCIILYYIILYYIIYYIYYIIYYILYINLDRLDTI